MSASRRRITPTMSKEFPESGPDTNFLSPAQLETARRSVGTGRGGDGKSYLGQQVVDWAKSSPSDPRLPEALFIATKANETYKYGCDGWDHDEETRKTAEKLLRERYPSKPMDHKTDRRPRKIKTRKTIQLLLAAVVFLATACVNPQDSQSFSPPRVDLLTLNGGKPNLSATGEGLRLTRRNIFLNPERRVSAWSSRRT